MAFFKFRDLENMSPSKLFDLIEGIDDEQAENSEYGGDSDAEDSEVSTRSTPSVSTPTRNSPQISTPTRNSPNISCDMPSTSSCSNLQKRSTRQFQFQKHLSGDSSDPYNSDDSVADPTYEAEDCTDSDCAYESPVPDRIPILPLKAIPMPVNTYSNVETQMDINSKDINDNQISSCSDEHADLEEELHMQWAKQYADPEKFKTYNFSEEFGPTIQVNFESPIEIFRNFFTDELIKQIVDQSCKYASQKGRTFEFYQEEFEAFVGILIIMGLHSLPSMRMFWSVDDNLQVNRIANIVTKTLFEYS